MGADFIFTIDSDDDLAVPPGRPSGPASASKLDGSRARANGEKQTQPKKKKKKRGEAEEENVEARGGEVDAGFSFDALGGTSASIRRGRDAWVQDVDEVVGAFRKPNAPPRVRVDDIIARRIANGGKKGPAGGADDWQGFGSSSSEGEETGDDPDVSGSEAEELAPEDEGADSEDELVSDGEGEDEDGDSAEEVASSLLGAVDVKDKAVVAEEDEEAVQAKAYYDQSTMPFDLATAEDLAKDSHDAPFASLPGSASLSRPILLGLSSLGLTTPTPIQRQTIPLALLGRDLVCSSVTGSGKTVGYLVPILERLHLRDRRAGPRTRVLVLTPTRELAVQVHQVAKSLSRFTDLTFTLCVGGMNIRTQEAQLRERPDVVVATPGRLIDHARNAHGFSLDTLEILVIDEADRILEEGFHDELQEIIEACPRQRQSLLFSATVSERVADLARLSLVKPVRVRIDPPRTTAAGLTQEFLRVRDRKRPAAGPRSDGDAEAPDRHREAVLVAVCRKAFSKGRTIVFFRSKKGAHRMKVLFTLCGLAAEELHGDLTQDQRLMALESFKAGKAGFLLATDLASRGLDIKGVDDVVNYECPSSYEIYLHRIGRTARAGKTGRALTLAGEADRKLVKEAKKHAPDPSAIKQRKVPAEVVARTAEELDGLEEEVAAVLTEEREEKMVRRGEMELAKGRNLLEHEDEIKSRPARTWFQSERQKQLSKRLGSSSHNAAFDAASSSTAKARLPPLKRDRFSGLSRAKKRRKMANEEDAKDVGQKGAVDAGIRAAKKAQRPGKIGRADDLGSYQRTQEARKADKKKQKKAQKAKAAGPGGAGGGMARKKAKSSFSVEMGRKAGAGGKKRR